MRGLGKVPGIPDAYATSSRATGAAMHMGAAFLNPCKGTEFLPSTCSRLVLACALLLVDIPTEQTIPKAGFHA